MKAGKGCFVGKKDLKSAFRHLPIRSDDWSLLVMVAYHPCMYQKYYFLTSVRHLVVGSYANFQCFFNALGFIFKHTVGKKLTNYLDNFLFVALVEVYCNSLICTFVDICKINFPVAVQKNRMGYNGYCFLRDVS